jgi:hypothetical protein
MLQPLPPAHRRIVLDSSPLPADIFGGELGQDGATIADLHRESFWTSEWAQYMHTSQELRFAKLHDWGREKMAQDIGDNANPLDHHVAVLRSVYNTCVIQRSTGKYDRFEGLQAEFVSGVHDTHELKHPDYIAEIGGEIEDIPSGKEIPAGHLELAEKGQNVIWDKFYSSVKPSLLEAANDIIFHRTDRLAARLYQAGHDREFLSDALRVGGIVLKALEHNLPPVQASRTPYELSRMAGMACSVIGYVVPRLEKHANDGIYAAELDLRASAAIRERIVTNLNGLTV